MPISGCHDLPLATFNLPSGNNLQNKPNSAATMSLPCSRFATAQPQLRREAPPGGGDSGMTMGGFFYTRGSGGTRGLGLGGRQNFVKKAILCYNPY